MICYCTINQKVKYKEGVALPLQNILRALSDPTRREILNLLKRESLPAGELAAHFPVSAAAISKHLAVLKEAGLIRDRREGQFIFYELNASVLEEVLLWIKGLRGEST